MLRFPMPVSRRAKIFAPFDALKGFSAALREKERIIKPRRILSEDALAELDFKAKSLKCGDHIKILYYHDGEYLTEEGFLLGIDFINRIIRLSDKKIDMDDIYEIL